jgi:hypothetical protein
MLVISVMTEKSSSGERAQTAEKYKCSKISLKSYIRQSRDAMAALEQDGDEATKNSNRQ